MACLGSYLLSSNDTNSQDQEYHGALKEKMSITEPVLVRNSGSATLNRGSSSSVILSLDHRELGGRLTTNLDISSASRELGVP